MILLSSFSIAKEAGNIHVFYGDLKRGQKAILDRVFKPRLDSLKKFSTVSDVVEWEKGSLEDLLKELKNPSTLGVIFLGHPAIKTEGVYPDKKIIHGYLQSGDGLYLPKKIFSAVHDKLAFLSILTCHESAILPLYDKSLPEGVDVLKSPTHGSDSLSNPLFEFTSFYSTPQVIDLISKNLEEGRYDSFEVEKSEDLLLSIQFRDLVSSHFTYTIEVDGKVIGVLKKEVNNRGRVKNSNIVEIKVPKNYIKNGVLKITADDPKRPTRPGIKVIDDIIIEGIWVNENGQKRSLLDYKIHLGDQEYNPDQNEALGFLRNRTYFEEAVYLQVWEGKL